LTLEKAAQASNVSVSTVSRVLSGKAHVAAKTREKVLAVCEELGVVPGRRGRPPASGSASGDTSQKTHVSMLVDRSVSSTFLSELIMLVQRQLDKSGFDFVLRSFSGEYADFVKAIQSIQSPEIAGCIAVGSFTNNGVRGILQANPKCVFVDFIPSPDLQVPVNVVVHDQKAAVNIAMHSLLSSGCKKLLCLQGTPDHYFSRVMREGFLSAIGQTDFTPGQLLTGNFTPAGGYESVKEALDSGLDFDGVFTNDEMAIGAIRAIKQSGKRIPDDIKIMGCDGIELGEHLHPPLSTVAMDVDALGRRAVKRLVEIIDMETPNYEKILLPAQLVIRETCVPACSEAAAGL